MGIVPVPYRTTEDRTQMTMQQERAAALVVQAIIETIEETGDQGAPLGVMYAALMGWISYDTFMTAINALARAGVIRISNNCAFAVKGRVQ
jgi:hypothetical protein